MCDITSYSKGRLVTIQFGHSSSSQYWHHNLRSKDHLHRGSAEGLLETAPAGDRTTDPPYKRSLMTALAGDQTADTSGQVINLNTNTAFKCKQHILGYLQSLQTVAELCADTH